MPRSVLRTSKRKKHRHLASTITSSTKEELETVGGLPHVCSSIVLKCLCLARIGRPDIVWFVNKQARADTRWTRACDKRLVRLISYIDFTGDFRQNCHVGHTAEQCTLGLFQDSFKYLDFDADFEAILCTLGSLPFVPISLTCKMQSSVSHSTTESEVSSLDAGLRMDGVPALDLGDLVIGVLHSSAPSSPGPGRPGALRLQ